MEKFNKLNYAEVEMDKISDYETSFIVSPLERGFANTLGNAMRRVLLSSISGVAPFAVRIEDVDHEFQTIAGVTEDVVKLILNLKNVKLFYNKEVFTDEEVIKITLNAPSGEVRAKDFILPIGVEIVDPEQIIAHTSKKNALKLELFLKSGRGFIAFSENKENLKKWQNKIESDLKSGSIIAIDSNFSPVDRVSYESVELNTSAKNIEEKLVLNVKTDNSVKAKDVVAQGANILLSHLKILSDPENLNEKVFEDQSKKEDVSAVKKQSIVTLDLSVRSYNCLKRSGIETLDQLADLSIDELKAIKNLGSKSMQEILDKLKQNDIVLILKGSE